MAFYNLSAIISKFLKKITLNQSEKDEICNEIGAISTTLAEQGGNGEDDVDRLAQYNSWGGLTCSYQFTIQGTDSGFTPNTNVLFLGFDSGVARIEGSGTGWSGQLYWPEVSGVTWSLPETSGLIACVDNATGVINKDHMPRMVTVLEVADQAARLALTLSQARNVIVVDLDTGKKWVLKSDQTNPATAANWYMIGQILETGDTNGKVVAHDSVGGISATSAITIWDMDNPTTRSLSFNYQTSAGEPSINVDNGTWLGDLVWPTLTADRIWTLPDATGTIALTTNTVTVTGDQSIYGFKVFHENVGFLDDVGITGDLIVDSDVTVGVQLQLPGQTIVDDYSALNKALADTLYAVSSGSVFVHSYMASDSSSVTSSATPIDSGVAVNLDAGTYLIEVFAYFTQGAGGSRVQLTFDGSMTSLGGSTEIGTTTSTVKAGYTLGGADGYNSQLTNASSTNPTHYTIKGLFSVSSGGQLKLRFAQSSSNAAATVLKAGSRIVASKLA